MSFIYLFIYLLLAALGLHCCTWAFSSCGERGLLFIAVSCRGARAPGLRASVAVARSLSSCGARAQLLRGMWDLPRPGFEPVSPELAGGLLTTAPPGKPQSVSFYCHIYSIFIAVIINIARLISTQIINIYNCTSGKRPLV